MTFTVVGGNYLNGSNSRLFRFIPILIVLFFLIGASFSGLAVVLSDYPTHVNDDSLNSNLESREIVKNEIIQDPQGITNDNNIGKNDGSEINVPGAENIATEPWTNKEKSIFLGFPNPQISEDDSYSRLNILDLNPTGAFGEPEMYSKPITWKFKPGTIIESVEFIPGKVNIEPLDLPLNPVQEPIPVSQLYDMYAYGEPDPTPPNPEIYSSNEPFPSQWFYINEGMGLDIDTGRTTLFVTVNLFPARYLPAQNQLMFTTEGELRIVYEEPLDDYFKSIKSANSGTARVQSISGAEPLNNNYRLVIIGPELFRQNLTRLAKYKNQTGLPAKFVSITEINSGKYFTVQGNDQQEKIKYFVKDAIENWNVTYIILGGDTPLVPHRNAYIHGEEGNTPSDLYYADIYDTSMAFCDWDYDNDGIYGEYDSGNVDRADLYADVLIGRLPASNSVELEVLVNKIINYESFTSGQPWFDNVTLSGTDTFSGTGTPEGEYTCEHITDNYLEDFTTTKIYETTTYERDYACTSTNIVNSLNKGAGFATFHDHGSPTSWAGKFSTSNAASLSNGDMLPFVNFDACSTGYFDRGSGDSLTEVVVLNPNGGGIISIGASRLGYGQWGTAHITRYSGYFNTHLYHNYYNGEGTAGRIVVASKTDYLNNIGIHTFADFKTIVEFVLFGDPSISIGGIPLKNINISCENNESYVMPADSAEYEVTVTNNGTFSRPIRLYVAGVPDDWKAELNKSLVVIPPKGEKKVKLYVNASESAVFQQVANVEVYAFYSKNKDRTISVITKTITNRIYGFDLNTTLLEDSVFPGEEASYWFRIINIGNAEDTINMTAELFETISVDGWEFNFSYDKVIVPAYETQLITLKVTQPLNTIFGTYNINVTGKILGYSGANSEDVIVIKVNILRTYGLKFIAAEELSKTYDPGESTTYHMTVANTGNYWDKYQMTILMKPPTWNISLISSKTFIVDAFSETIKELNIQIPDETLVGKYSIKVRAQSTGNYTILENLMIEVRVNRSYGLQVDIGATELTADPSEIVEFNLTIKHLGNAEDEVQLNLQNFPSKWYSSLTPKIELEPFEVYEISFQVSPNLRATVGQYPFQLKLSLMGNLENQFLDLNITVNQIDGFDLYIVNNNYSVNPGGSQRYSLFIENTGNHDDVIELNVSNIPNEWSIDWSNGYLTGDSLSLGPFGYKTDVNIKINTNLKTLAGTYKLLITGKLQSTGEEIKAELRLKVKPVYGISLELNLEDSKVLIQPGDEFNITFNITNNGNTRDNVSRTVSGLPADWELLTTKNYTYSLEPYEERMEIIRVEVPEYESEREINLTIKARSKINPQTAAQEQSEIVVEVPPETGQDGSSDWGNLETMFEKNFFSVILPILILIVVTIIISVLIIKQRKRYREEMMYPPHSVDEYGYEGDHDYEAEKLYGPPPSGHSHIGTRPSRRRSGRPLPRPPTPPPSHGHGEDSMRWVDEDDSGMKHTRSSVIKKKVKPKPAKMALCPTCGEQVSSEVKECPYCGEVFEDFRMKDDGTRSRVKEEERDWEDEPDLDYEDKAEDEMVSEMEEEEVEDWDEDSDEDIEEELDDEDLEIEDWDEEDELPETDEDVEFEEDEDLDIEDADVEEFETDSDLEEEPEDDEQDIDWE
jgi:uncharacterized membrane protein